jgi:NhaP-type Na+/H+ or K+/H+ antiporter
MYELGQQPLFRLLGAFIVLMVANANPTSGIVAVVVWFVWIWWSRPNRYFNRVS